MADLRREIQDKIKAGIEKFGTVNRAITYSVTGDNTYDTNTGKHTEVVESIHEFVVIFSDFSTTRIFSSDTLHDEVPIRAFDKLVIFSSSLMPIRPSINDTIEDMETNSFWRVLGVGGDPAEAHYELHVRPFDNVK